jgi:hypothetical protein
VDLGYADQTAILYGYWDFVRAKLVIEAEDILDSPNTDEIHLLVKQRERELWGDQRPYLRITDIEPRFVADMANIYKMTFHQARRTDSLGAVNLLRTDVQNRVLELGDVPVLKEQLRSGTWNRKKNDFTRTAEHHLDALAALKYLVRAVNRSRNPNPADPYSGRPVAGQPFWHPPQGSGSKTIPDWADLTPDTPLGRKLKSRRRNRRG